MYVSKRFFGLVVGNRQGGYGGKVFVHACDFFLIMLQLQDLNKTNGYHAQ
jgi:hypothetical protein